jgi:hypothetical protein
MMRARSAHPPVHLPGGLAGDAHGPSYLRPGHAVLHRLGDDDAERIAGIPTRRS